MATEVIVVVVVVVVVVVEWLYYSKRIIIVRRADISENVSSILVGKMCVFVHVQSKLPLFFGKTLTPQNGC